MTPYVKPRDGRAPKIDPEPVVEEKEIQEIVPTQIAMDLIDEAGMESFPCSDPPSYVRCHA